MTSMDEADQSQDDDISGEYTHSRDLVMLMFRAVLRRDPEEGDAAAFTNAVQSGMPIYDFVSELMSTPEFRTSGTPIQVPPPAALPTGPASGEDLSQMLRLSLGLLQARLVDKGCQIQIGPAVDHGASALNMERVLRTLAAIEFF